MSIRFRQQTIDRIDAVLDEFEFRSRSHFVVAAVKRYLEALEEEMNEDETEVDDEEDDEDE